MSLSQRGAVEFRGLRKDYGKFTAIPDLNLKIEPGQLVTLLGPSGCGKTTTLRMLAGLETPNEGTILIGGEDVTRLPPNRRDVTMVFQSYALFPHMSVIENIAYGLEAGGLRASEARAQAGKGLELVGLSGLGSRLPSELSGGQQQRVAVARALVLEPQVLLLDEPLSNLDARLRRRVRTEIRDLQKRLGFTAVYVTHDQDEALAVSDRIVVMKDGRIAQDGSPRELYEAPASEFIADFIGEANVVDCEVLAAGHVAIGGYGFALNTQAGRQGKARLALRPGAMHLGQAGEGLAGVIASAAYQGDHIEYEVDTAAGRLFLIDHASSQPLARGSAIGLTYSGKGAALIPQGGEG